MPTTLLKKANRIMEDRFNGMGVRSTTGERTIMIHLMSKAYPHDHENKTGEESISELQQEITTLLEQYQGRPSHSKDFLLLRDLQEDFNALLQTPQEPALQEG